MLLVEELREWSEWGENIGFFNCYIQSKSRSDNVQPLTGEERRTMTILGGLNTGVCSKRLMQPKWTLVKSVLNGECVYN